MIKLKDWIFAGDIMEEKLICLPEEVKIHIEAALECELSDDYYRMKTLCEDNPDGLWCAWAKNDVEIGKKALEFIRDIPVCK